MRECTAHCEDFEEKERNLTITESAAQMVTPNDVVRHERNDHLVSQGKITHPVENRSLKRKRACVSHTRNVRERYGTLIAQFGCICKELISRNLEPCCMSTPRLSGVVDKEADKCCGGDKGEVKSKDNLTQKEASCSADDLNNLTDCEVPIIDDRDSGEKVCATRTGTKCCSSKIKAETCDTATAASTESERRATFTDPEGTADTKEHVVLDVQGMTCTGCETKLERALGSIPGIFNIKTSIVMLQAELDLDIHVTSVDKIIQAVETSTGFRCSPRNTKGQEIEVIVSGDVRTFVNQTYPAGVIQMRAVDKHIVCITFDAHITGARDIIAHPSLGSPLQLGPLRGIAEVDIGRKHAYNMAWLTLLSAFLTIPVLVLAWAPLPERPIAYGSASLALATIVQVVIAGPFYPSTLRSLLFTHVIEVDLLIVLSTSTAYVFSVVSFAYTLAGRPLSTGEFFETSTLLVTLIMVGRLVSAIARQKAVESVSIKSLQANKAMICSADGQVKETIDVRLLQYGDYFKVLPDSCIPTDGVILDGITEVDESLVTGESRPITKQPGSTVTAGSINLSGSLVVRLTHLPNENTISNIVAMVDQAKFSKAKTQEIVDVVASYFVPVILVLCIVTFAIWMGIGIGVRRLSGGDATANAITYAVSVLIVSCPCAIGLAVPMVLVIAGGIIAKHGIIVKSAITFETGRLISHAVFDKTGTLTEGRLLVKLEEYPTGERDLALALALRLTMDSKHPVSVAIAQHLKKNGIPADTTMDDIMSITGKGMEGWLGGKRVRCGNTRWLKLEQHAGVKILLAQGLTVCAVTIGNRKEPVAIFGLADSLRPEAVAIFDELRGRGIKTSLLSGDDAGVVDAIASRLAIPADHVKSCCSPADKLEYLKALMVAGDKVLFCGDGANDAASLAQADIGVHISAGSEIASTAADAVLIRPNLEGILVLLDMSKAAFRRIMFNFAWSFVYNLFAILLAAGAFVNARIAPQYAGLGEIVSVLPVILIALQLRMFKVKALVSAKRMQ